MTGEATNKDMVQILLATYNGEKYLTEQLDSLLCQSYKNIEIVCRDDGSDDKTCEILEKYNTLYPDKIKLIKDNMRMGKAGGNFMKLLENADAPYVMFCDQDDYWLPEKVSEMLKYMKKAESDYVNSPILVYSDYIAVNEELVPINDNVKNNQTYRSFNDLSHLLVQNYITGCTIMMNKKLYMNSIADSPCILMHDWWEALCAASSGEIIHINKPLMYYRQHGGNAVGVVNVRSIKYIVSKIFDEDSKRSMDLYVSQARALLDEYPLITEEGKNKILNFIDIPGHNKIIRCLKLIRGGYCKSTLPRIAGQLWFV